MKRIILICMFGFLGTANAALIGGIEFPDGISSFADSVVSYSPGPDVGAGYDNSLDALGAPDNSVASIGNGGELVLQFIDNSLTTSGDAVADLWIFETGRVTESFNVAISTNNSTWLDLGDVLGQPTGIDIDSVVGVITGAFYSFVRIRDVDPDQTGSPFGEADIDAVGAISSAPPVQTVPIPAAVWLFGSGLIGLIGMSIKSSKVTILPA